MRSAHLIVFTYCLELEKFDIFMSHGSFYESKHMMQTTLNKKKKKIYE